MTRRLLTPVALVAAIAVTVAGCGGDSDSETPSPPNGSGDGASATSSPNGGGEGGNGDGAGGGDDGIMTSSLDKEEFIKRAGTLCRREKKGLIKKASAYVQEHSSEGLPPPVMTANGVKEVVMPVMEAQIEVVRELGAPEGDEEEIEEMLAAQQRAVDTVREQRTIDPVDGPVEYFEAANKSYERYGLEACSYNL